MLKKYSKERILKDSLIGMIIALISIPISMGYAQVSGLPVIYGLYGSVFPILFFCLFSTSPQFIFGVDAAPAALVGAVIADFGIASGSTEAVKLIPLITALTGFWLLLLSVLKAGRMITYISVPVMGGFISGISTTIILMQIPKLLGGQSGRGELFELLPHIYKTIMGEANLYSALFGGFALLILLLGKKIFPKFPMAIAVMLLGAIMGYYGVADHFGIKMLDAVEPGLPVWKLPEFQFNYFPKLLTESLTIALVIMAESLLASKNFAARNGDKLSENREIMAYAMGNIISCFVGCCPVNGSVSRTSLSQQYGGKTKVVSISASVTMLFILLFATRFIGYLPVPILTAIVISALLGTIEFELAHRLYQQDRKELLIFLGSFSGVLLFGTIYGVIIGVLLSFVSIILRTANPKRSFLGVIPGHEGFHSLERNTHARPLKNVIIYRFSANLYFANVHILINDIESALLQDTKCVIIDSGAICNMDITAADSLDTLRKSLNEKGIHLYFASHIGVLNDRFRQLGLGNFITNGYCRRSIQSALSREGFHTPYELEDSDMRIPIQKQSRLEFEWAFGKNSDLEMEHYIEMILSQTEHKLDLHSILHATGRWEGLSSLDQSELLLHIESHIPEIAVYLQVPEEEVVKKVEERKAELEQRVMDHHPDAIEILEQYSHSFDEQMRQEDPELYQKVLRYRKKAILQLLNEKEE